MDSETTHENMDLKEACFVCNLIKDIEALKDFENQLVSQHECTTIFECEICNKQFERKGNLYEHKYGVHNFNSSEDPENIGNGSMEADVPITCDICYKDFPHKDDIQVHKSKHHTKDCSVVLKKFKLAKKKTRKIHSDDTQSKVDLKLSVVLEPLKYQCDICEKSFLEIDVLKDHVAVHEFSNKANEVNSTDNEIDYHCKVCDETITSDDDLNSHIQAIHVQLQKNHCDLCDNKFSSKEEKVNHLKFVHNETKSFKCDFCDKRYIMGDNLKKHIELEHFDDDDDEEEDFVKSDDETSSNAKPENTDKQYDQSQVEKETRRNGQYIEGEGFTEKVDSLKEKEILKKLIRQKRKKWKSITIQTIIQTMLHQIQTIQPLNQLIQYLVQPIQFLIQQSQGLIQRIHSLIQSIHVLI